MTLTRLEAEETKGMADEEGLQVPADALLSLSSLAGTGAGGSKKQAMAAEGVFECKTCRKRFPSFQALGGHRTSHTRLQARTLSDAAPAAADRDRARVHECAVCGLEFSMGQALGGHMRRHRGEAPPTLAIVTTDVAAAQPEQERDEAMPDLNFPPLEDGDGGSDGQKDQAEPSSGGDDDDGSKPQLLNLLV